MDAITSITARQLHDRQHRSTRTSQPITAQDMEILIAARRIQHRLTGKDLLLQSVHAPHVARIIATIPGVSLTIRASASIAAGLQPLLPADWGMHDDVNNALYEILTISCAGTWIDRLAHTVHAGWGQPVADVLIQSASRGLCRRSAAASLIGPSNRSVQLLINAWDAAFAVQCWGKSQPSNPTGWIQSIATREYQRIRSLTHEHPTIAGMTLPWMPNPQTIASSLPQASIGAALRTYATAPDAVLQSHHDIIQHLAANADNSAIGDLARLACRIPDIWRIVGIMITHAPSWSHAVTVAVPWDNLPVDIQQTLIDLGRHNRTCAAIACARGVSMSVEDIGEPHAIAFFSALDPRSWRRMNAHERLQWISFLPMSMRYLAVRSLGADVNALAWCEIIDSCFVRALRPHCMTSDDICWYALPILLGSMSPTIARAVMDALPSPPPDESHFRTIIAMRRRARHHLSFTDASKPELSAIVTHRTDARQIEPAKASQA